MKITEPVICILSLTVTVMPLRGLILITTPTRKIKSWSLKSTIEDFRNAAFDGIVPARLDYASCIKPDSSKGADKIFKYKFDKKGIR